MRAPAGAATVYRGAPASTLLVEPLDSFTAVFHRASGITHLLAEPAPQILAMLGERAMTLAALMAALQDRFDLPDAAADALAERVAELVAAGLVEVDGGRASDR